MTKRSCGSRPAPIGVAAALSGWFQVVAQIPRRVGAGEPDRCSPSIRLASGRRFRTQKVEVSSVVCSRVRMSTVLSRGRDRFPRPAGGSAGAAVVRGTYVRYRRRLPRGHSPSARGHPSPRPDGESMTGRTVAIARTTDPPPVGLIPQAADVRQLSGWGQGATPRFARVRPRAACCFAHCSMSERSQIFVRPPLSSTTGRGMSS